MSDFQEYEFHGNPKGDPWTYSMGAPSDVVCDFRATLHSSICGENVHKGSKKLCLKHDIMLACELLESAIKAGDIEVVDMLLEDLYALQHPEEA